MNGKKLLIAFLLVDFVALTVWAAVEHGGFFSAIAVHLSTPIGIQSFCDLVIALIFALAWLWKDARRRGVNPLPYVAITCALGSVGPLVYLLRRPEA